MSGFFLALCQPGAERWLKAEVARVAPRLASAFQRPGLVTFKGEGDAPVTVFGRFWAVSEGPARTADEVRAVAARVGARVVSCGPRDAGVPGDVPPARQAAFDADAAAWRAALHDATPGGRLRPGDVVLDVITAPDEPAMVGWHRHRSGEPPEPCGRWGVSLPEDAPSRAWLKWEEAIRWSGADLRAGDAVLEIGAAPGGGTRALVDRGLTVIAVDPGPLDPTLAADPRVRWIPRPIGDVGIEDVPASAAWIACDAKIPPGDVLRALGRWVQHLRGLRGLLWTVKLVDDRVVSNLPKILDAARALGFDEVRAVQLPANRRDVTVVALRGAPRRAPDVRPWR